ncbi:MAG TPA: hypothetical protein VKA09_09155 [Nitrososphaeraceae archaeon]|nr:hypothetical protein [Nitrososphaeraceae archaeon]
MGKYYFLGLSDRLNGFLQLDTIRQIYLYGHKDPGGINIVLEITPRQFSGISLGMTILFNLVGGSIGPAIVGIYMQTNQAIVKGISGSFPSPDSYNLIFLSLV